jgi:peptidoglycan/xylan/chitin deacetylase (PgdA/CDA1 family)
MRAYRARGHQLAGHGYDHTSFPRLSRAQLLDQCARTDRALGVQLVARSWLRPPHGALDVRALAVLVAARYTVALWSLDSLDYEDRDPALIAARCAPAQVRGGEVVLLHEGQAWTLAALPRSVASLREAGYEFATMFDLFAR